MRFTEQRQRHTARQAPAPWSALRGLQGDTVRLYCALLAHEITPGETRSALSAQRDALDHSDEPREILAYVEGLTLALLVPYAETHAPGLYRWARGLRARQVAVERLFLPRAVRLA